MRGVVRVRDSGCPGVVAVVVPGGIGGEQVVCQVRGARGVGCVRVAAGEEVVLEIAVGAPVVPGAGRPRGARVVEVDCRVCCVQVLVEAAGPASGVQVVVQVTGRVGGA
ncbi:hypothetical protein [Actinoplanes couchii]|uniref:hypothetical protein n=1 Tax=Actinoplanes couchii TaxID=403638 RepID=UPI001942A69A|nr:hypothetical protein [Actinoplanes couchii]MDR6323088.1 hypothetical protein [Actinoplanes couchii]